MTKHLLASLFCLLVSGLGYAQTAPVAVDDNLQGTTNALNVIDVLNIGVDSDADADEIGPQSVGTNGTNGLSFAGATVSVNNNGTPSFIGDDVVHYTPLTGWTGLDSAIYILTDTTGMTDQATIRIFIWNDDDLDGLFGTLDLDSDNDGILDTDEDGGTGFDPSADADGDGIANYVDNNDATPGFPAFIDSNNDGVIDVYDTDLDGVPDFTDVDSDNDGIPDAFEGNQGVAPTGYNATFGRIVGFDTDNDGLIDDVDNAPGVAYGAGSTSTQLVPDTDGDGISDHQDLDSDNDGIPDVAEAGGADTDGDAMIDGFQDANGDGVYDAINLNQLPVPNTDGVGLRDYLDMDSDDDGIDDTSEGYSSSLYPGAATGSDADNDGIDDAFDQNCAGGSSSTFNTSDYAEENTGTNAVSTGSSDLELTYDGVQQDVGVVFGGVNIPQGATISNAYIQFEVDEVDLGAVAVTIFGEDEDNAANYTGTAGEVSGRNPTTASETWSPNDWLTVGDAGVDQRTVDLSSIVQEIVDRGGWTSGNRMSFLFSGSGTNTRTAENDPTLVVQFSSSGVASGCALITPLTDTDNDGTPDIRDLDSDGDGENDAIEGHDANFDGTADVTPSGNDVDNDGIDDNFDTDGGTGFGTNQSASLPNEDLDGEPDWRDLFDIVNPAIFYYTCDATEELYSFNVFTGVSTFIGSYVAQANQIESIAYWDGVLYGANSGTFGTLNTTNGTFTTVGDIDGGGTLSGSDGPVSITDVDGLSFDPWTGILWSSNRRSGDYDILFQIDPNTGAFIEDAFGVGVDYVVIDGTSVYELIDDIAVSPIDGKMYTIGNDGTDDQLLNINKYTGAVTLVVGTMPESDIEGMTYFNAGNFYGTIGSVPGEFWEINPNNAQMSGQVILPCGDPEAVAALTADPNRITGTVWDDVDQGQTINGAEVGLANVTVNLYYDVNGDGQLDPGDIQLQSTTTDVNGDYDFTFATTANLVISIDQTTLPSGYGLTTDDIEVAVFTDNVNFNETDANNNFGATTSSDCDGDGIPDFAEGGVGVDFDGDGVDNMCDLDSDNDGILDSDEFTEDTDGDGLPDYTDYDSDNDGIPDAIEANSGVAPTGYTANQGFISGTDTDGDGLLDVIDADPTTPYGGGSTSTLLNPDHDVDGIPDYLDKDSDNDGILDVIEAGGTDANGDGEADGFNDGNNDGLSDGLNTNPLPVFNTDGNGNPDYIDFDSDDDGIDDTREGLSTAGYTVPTIISDADNDGIIDFWDTNVGGNPIVPNDADNDGTPDYQDLDTDNDGILDIIEGNDANMDGVADYAATGTDSDGDGIDDAFDQNCTSGVPAFGRLDYAEEDNGSGAIDLGSSDLELTYDGAQQTVGILYGNVNIPQGTSITNAYIQFETDEAFTGAVTINIHGEDVNNAALYSIVLNDVTSRTTTTATQTWSPNDWNTVGESGANQQTVDISNIIQEIVNRPGWVSGNNLGIILSGSGTNRRTAENDPILFVNFVGGAVTWGCATNTPLQDTDSDTEHDFRDIDDDGDMISTSDETADLDGNGTPDYLEVNPCGPGFVEITTAGNADLVVASNLVTNQTNALNAPDGAIVTYQNNNSSRVDLDMTDVLPIGANVTMTWRKISGGGDAELRVRYSTTGTGGWTSIQTFATSSTSLVTSSFTMPAAARYLRIDRRRRVPGLDAIEYSFTSCEADKDMDGIPNSTDDDDDNDGIADSVEGTLDTDGDGITNDCDLDSDNDGIPDAIEANNGVLPAGMTTEGTYPPTYIVANDGNGNGWIETSEGGPTYSNLVSTPINTDGDGQPDYLDLDADGDCIPDAVEANLGVLPTNMDTNGQFPIAYATANDADGDGFIDDIDPDAGGSILNNPDTDGDGQPNYLDLDSDGDTVSDALEAYDPDLTPSGGDADNDGLSDACDPDAGGTIANMPDEDCNGIFDYLDAEELTTQSGSYTISATWDDGTVPVAGKSVRIAPGHTLTLTGNTVVASVSVSVGGTLDIAGYELTILGRFNMDGTFIHNLGKVKMAGTCEQTICGDINFFDLEIDNSTGVDMACGDITIDRELDLTDGVLDVCSATSVTLTSSNGQNGYIAGGGTGTVTCDVIRERFKLGCQDGFMLLATPYSTNTYNDWADDFLMTGFPGTAYPTFWPSVHLYDETQPGTSDDGYVTPPSQGSNIPRGEGHYVYIGMYQLPNVIDMTGEPILSPFNFNLDYTSYGQTLEDGWNLCGNPYPSPIDWDNTSGWTNVGCCNSIWTWNECNTQFSSYIDGVATNGGTNVVESCQAFWVKAHIPGASLNINRNAMTNLNGDFKSTGSQIDAVIKLHINGFSDEDETAIRMKTGASHFCDNVGDAFKQVSNETLMGLYTLTDDNVGMSINAFPNDSMSKTVPVMVRVPQNGSYTMDFGGLTSFPADVCVLFEDLVTGDIVDMKSNSFYTFTMNTASTFEHRFNVTVYYPIMVEEVTDVCGSNPAYAVFQPNGVGPYNVTWTDIFGNVVKQSNNINTTDTLSGVNVGDYVIDVEDLGAMNCAYSSDTVQILQNPEQMDLNGAVWHTSCNGTGNDGSINLDVNFGSQPYTYNWSNGSAIQDISGLQPGTYVVDVTDSSGCSVQETFVVNSGANLQADINGLDTINLAWQNPTVSFQSNSIGANALVWYPHDGSTQLGQTASFTYNTIGLFEMKLAVSNGPCTDTATHVIAVIDDPTDINNPQNTENYNVWSNGDQFVVDVIKPLNSVAKINLLDMQGKLVTSREIAPGYVGQINIGTESLSTGIYNLIIVNQEDRDVFKLNVTR